MARVRVAGFTLSLDGYGAGPNQDINNPLGDGGIELHQWLIPTRTFQQALFGKDGGTTGLDSRAQHVRPHSRGMAGHELERLVGR